MMLIYIFKFMTFLKSGILMKRYVFFLLLFYFFFFYFLLKKQIQLKKTNNLESSSLCHVLDIENCTMPYHIRIFTCICANPISIDCYAKVSVIPVFPRKRPTRREVLPCRTARHPAHEHTPQKYARNLLYLFAIYPLVATHGRRIPVSQISGP